MRRVLSAIAVLVCALAIAACNDDDKSSSSEETKNSSAAKDSGKSSKTGTPLAGTDPCTLLKPTDVPELSQDNYFKPQANGDTCSGYDFAVRIKEVSAAVYDMDFNGSEVTALPDIAGHKAAISETDISGLKSCNVVLEVTRDQLVDVTVTHSEDPPKTCDIAKKAAAVVAGRIPN